MKKEIVIVLCLVILIIIGHVYTQKYTKNFFEDMSNELNYMKEKILKGNVDNSELKENIENIKEKWDEKYDKLAYYIEHDELEKVEIQLVLISANVEVANYEKCIEELEKCKFMLEHIKDKDALQLVNIF